MIAVTLVSLAYCFSLFLVVYNIFYYAKIRHGESTDNLVWPHHVVEEFSLMAAIAKCLGRVAGCPTV